ncbi:hypothetical protein D3C77_660950 [compost metagenome]
MGIFRSVREKWLGVIWLVNASWLGHGARFEWRPLGIGVNQMIVLPAPASKRLKYGLS